MPKDCQQLPQEEGNTNERNIHKRKKPPKPIQTKPKEKEPLEGSTFAKEPLEGSKFGTF